MYKIDIKKPPLPPPNRIVHEGNGETIESINSTRAWYAYIDKYRETLAGFWCPYCGKAG